MGYFYLGLALLGAVGPYAFLGQFLAAHGPDLDALKAQAVQSPVSAYLAANMLVAALVTVVFIVREGRRIGMKGLWLPVAATFAIGVSCGLPLFLYLRKVASEMKVAGEPAAPAQPPAEPRRPGR
jgi:membrane associated rhomboid family serine protease